MEVERGGGGGRRRRGWGQEEEEEEKETREMSQITQDCLTFDNVTLLVLFWGVFLHRFHRPTRPNTSNGSIQKQICLRRKKIKIKIKTLPSLFAFGLSLPPPAGNNHTLNLPPPPTQPVWLLLPLDGAEQITERRTYCQRASHRVWVLADIEGGQRVSVSLNCPSNLTGPQTQ